MKKFRIISYILFVVALIINYICSNHSNLVEIYYSKNINIYMVKFLSKITSTFSFSYFEIMIYAFLISVILSLLKLFYILFFKREKFLSKLKNILLNYLAVLSIVYFLFIILWGINYNKMPLEATIKKEYQLKNDKTIDKKDFDKEDLANLYEYLIEMCNKNKVDVDKLDVSKNNKQIEKLALKLNNAYDNVYIDNLNNVGDYSKAKIILSSKFLIYTSITGIYSPFTGEANINTNQPTISMPFTILHEMAHQRGYTSEDEANFLAYIACINNEDEYVRYSGYFMALRYTASALSKVDYNKYKELNKKIDISVAEDFNNYSAFWKKYQGKVNQVSDKMNDMYLKSNRVKEGTDSYGKVVDLILIYNYLYE